ncbi:hypothetical protein ABG067_008039 [Albugo candida]
MTVAKDQQERMTYIALISKALLHTSWASNSILLYIEMIMHVETVKGFVAPRVLKLDELQKLNPANMIKYEHISNKAMKEYRKDEQSNKLKLDFNMVNYVFNYLMNY